MNFSFKNLGRSLCVILAVALACVGVAAQQPGTGTLRGQVTDELGGVVIGATVTATDANGKSKTATTGSDGNFVIPALAPGKYTLRAAASGFAVYEDADVDVEPTTVAPMKIVLSVSLEKEEVTVASESPVNVDDAS